MENNYPIGIFDSGIGGLTIAHSLVTLLPQESIIYFGDTAHLPYGDKSAAAIQSYSIKIAEMLLEQHCKMILIACNSASAAAFELVQDFVGTKCAVINVIDPMVQFLAAHYSKKNIGLIGTKQTVNSNVYKKKLDSLHTGINLSSLPTNLLAAAIEEFGNHPIIDSLLAQYLSHDALNNIDALILACTHYPIIKNKIHAYFGDNITIIDPSEIVARAVSEQLASSNLLASNLVGSKHFYISDYTDYFANGTKLFFKEDIVVEHYPLWD